MPRRGCWRWSSCKYRSLPGQTPWWQELTQLCPPSSWWWLDNVEFCNTDLWCLSQCYLPLPRVHRIIFIFPTDLFCLRNWSCFTQHLDSVSKSPILNTCFREWFHFWWTTWPHVCWWLDWFVSSSRHVTRVETHCCGGDEECQVASVTYYLQIIIAILMN